MSLWPFRQIILRSGAAQSKQALPDKALGGQQLRSEGIFHFGDATEIRRCLGMTNRLTGCAAIQI